MDLIQSFQVDHTRILPGIYESRVDTVSDDFVTTFDVRMKKPNAEPAVAPAAMHTIEHVVATYLRNHPVWKDRLIYWGPMGCLTGFYFIANTPHEATAREIEPLMRRAFRHMASLRGEVPGATPANCGNWLLHDLPMAKFEAREFLSREWKFTYPKTRRPKSGGKVFFDA